MPKIPWKNLEEILKLISARFWQMFVHGKTRIASGITSHLSLRVEFLGCVISCYVICVSAEFHVALPFDLSN